MSEDSKALANANETMKRDASREIVMSYMLAASERTLNKYAERLLLHLIEMAQEDIDGMEFKTGLDLRPHIPNFYFAKVETPISVVVDLPICCLRAEGEQVKSAFILKNLQKLQQSLFCWNRYKMDEDGNPVKDKDGNYIRQVVSVQMLGRVVMDEDLMGYLEVTVDKDIWRAMEDFDGGFRCIDMTIVGKLKNKYALRMYELLARQQRPITYGIERLRGIMGVRDKYARIRDFVKYVIEPAQKELNMVSPYTFEYSLNRDDVAGAAIQPGTKAVSSITFYPVHQVDKESIRGYRCDKQFVFLDHKVNEVLEKIGFTNRQVTNNIELFELANRVFGKDDGDETLEQFLRRFTEKHESCKNVVGYVVGSVKNRLEEVYGIKFRSKAQKKRDEEANKIFNAERKKKAKKGEIGNVIE